jgi:transposase-like protein
MAERPRMTAAQLADKLLADEHADVLRESVAWMARELMEADVSAQIGAELGERSLERTTHRNGYRSRDWDTRVGSIELAIPKLRQGSYFPSFLEPRRRAEQALVAVVQEAYVNGVSTRKVDRLVEQMGLHHLGKDQVSRCAAAWTSRSGSSASGRWRAPPPTCGGRHGGTGPRAGRGAPQGAGDRLRRAPQRPPGGARPGRR